MLQSTQVLKQEIMASLDFLSPESLRVLARFVSFLRSNIAEPEIAELDSAISIAAPTQVSHIRSPKLANPSQIADFRKEIIAIQPDDTI